MDQTLDIDIKDYAFKRLAKAAAQKHVTDKKNIIVVKHPENHET